MPSREEIAYAAGLIDGEGHVSIRADNQTRSSNPAIRAVVMVNMTEPKPLYWMESVFGGHTHPIQPRSNDRPRKPVYRWDIYGRKAAAFLRLILPYLKVKDRQSTLVIQLHDEGAWGRGFTPPTEEMDRRWSLKLQVNTLNKRGSGALLVKRPA